MPFPTISSLWEDRFHRKDVKETGWVFYISRPGLELLRKSDENGENAYKLIHKVVSNFLKEHQPSTVQEGKFILETKTNDDSPMYATLAYPFNIKEEVKGKRGIVIHIGEGKKTKKNTPILHDVEGFPSMFDPSFQNSLKYKLENDTPPGINNSDPMWMEFSSSKILPTDQLLHLEIDSNKFRNIISHQFIEIRLIKSKGNELHSSREQMDALVKFQSFSSGYTHFAGAPGTGKSTLLHMACAHRLAEDYTLSKLGEISEEEKCNIMYYVPSAMLRDEARREIRCILSEVYGAKDKQIHDMKDYITYVTQEDLYAVALPNRNYNLLSDNKDLLRKKLKIKDNYTRGARNNRVDDVTRAIRQIIFGVFGEKMEFSAWRRNNVSKFEKAWKEKPLFLPQPSIRQSTQHKLTLERFFNYPKAEKLLKDIDSLELYDGQSLEQFWDPTAVIYQSYLQHHHEKSIWKKLEGKMDYIVVDEIQDINLSEVRILLKHFSSKQSEKEYRDFRFIGAGDENQNVKGLIYIPQNQHFRFLFTDWMSELRQQKTSEGYILSHQLEQFQDDMLVASYRVFDEMIPFATDILQQLRQLYQEKSVSRRANPSKMKQTQFGRKGVFVTLDKQKHMDSNKEFKPAQEWCQEILAQLEIQLDLNEDNPPIRIAVTFDEDDYDRTMIEHKNSPLMRRLKEVGNDFALQLEEMLSQFSKTFFEEHYKNNFNSDESQELRRALALRGFMSVKDIKGLTIPVAVVIPPSDLNSNQGKGKADRLSKFLVQITRAQYFNLLVENTRVFTDDVKVKPVITNIRGGKEIDWLNNILANSVGFNQSFNSLFEATLEQYGSFILWKRLKQTSTGLGQEVNLLVQWLEEFHIHLNTNQIDIHWDEMLRYEKDSKNVKSLKFNGEVLSFDKIKEIEDTWMLGERLNKKLLTSLRLFTKINRYLREKANEDRTVQAKDLIQYIDNWISMRGEDLDFNEQLTGDWFNIILKPKLTPGNVISEQIKATFALDHEDDFVWPTMSPPRLQMGSWRLKVTGKMLNQNSGDENEHDSHDAWMEEGSSFYNIPSEVLLFALKDSNTNKEATGSKSFISKMKLFLGMTSLNATTFVEAFTEFITIHSDEDLKHEIDHILDWFVNVFSKSLPKNQKQKMETYPQFKKKVRKGLENSLIRSGPGVNHKQIISNYISASVSIEQLEERLQAFGFEEWHKSIDTMDLFENTVKMAHRDIQRYSIFKRKNDERKFALKLLNQTSENRGKANDNFLDGIEERRDWIVKYYDSSEYDSKEFFLEVMISRYEKDDWTTNGTPEYGSNEWVFKNIQDKILKYKQENEQLAAEMQRFQRQKEDLDAEVKKLESNDMNKKPNNPFSRGKEIHNFFKQQLRRNSDTNSTDNQHENWFKLLYGVPEFLSENVGWRDISELKLSFPSMKTEFMKEIHVCVDFYSEGTSWLENLQELLIKSIRPGPYDNKLFTHLLDFISSMQKAYASPDNKRELFAHRISPVAKGKKEIVNDLYHRFYQTLMLEIRPVQEEFLGYFFNTSGEGNYRLSRENMSNYLTNPKGLFILATITKDFSVVQRFNDAWRQSSSVENSEHILKLWSELRWEGNDTLLDYVMENDKARNRRHVLLHRPWNFSKQSEHTLPSHLVNGATFRAIAMLAIDKSNKAAIEFEEAGLMNYSASIKLSRAYDAHADSRSNQIRELAEIARLEKITLQDLLYSVKNKSKGSETHNHRDRNEKFSYGIGQEWREKLQLNGDSIKIRNKSDDNRYGFLAYFEHYERATHSEKLSLLFNSMHNDEENPDEYIQRIEQYKKTDWNSHTLFWDHSEGSEDKKREVLSWSWVKNHGFKSKKRFNNYENKGQILDFVVPILNQNPRLSDDEYLNKLEQITGIDGAMLAYHRPETAHLSTDEIESGLATKERLDTKLRSTKIKIDEIKDAPEYAENRPLIRAFKNLNLSDPGDCLEFLNDYDGILRINHKNDLEREFTEMKRLNEELNGADSND